MSKNLARLLSMLISDYIRINLPENMNIGCIASIEYEWMEKKLLKGDFDAIERHIGARLREPLKLDNNESKD